MERQALPIFQRIIQIGCQRENKFEQLQIGFLLREIDKIRDVVVRYDLYGVLPARLPFFGY